MPAVMAQLVIRIGRSRPSRPSTAARLASAPSSRRCCSANVTSRIALATATPMAMIDPMNDWRLTVVRVSQSISTTPATTAGVVETTTSASRTDWKLAVSSSRITTIDIPRPMPSPRRISSIGRICPRTSTVAPLGGAPARRIARSTRPATRPRSSPAMLAVRLTDRFML